jgi:hypothetical protein
MARVLTKPLRERSSKNIPCGGIKRGRRVRPITSLPTVKRLSSAILDVSQPCEPSQPVKMTALLYFIITAGGKARPSLSLITSLPTVKRLSSGIVDVSQPYEPSQPVKMTALLYFVITATAVTLLSPNSMAKPFTNVALYHKRSLTAR